MARKRKNIKFEDLEFPTYEETMEKICKAVGKKPSLPQNLPKANWSEQALRVLSERYLQKDSQGEVAETPEEMCWRVSWEIASAEAIWGAKKKEVLDVAQTFYHLLISKEFLPNSPTLMNAGTGNNLQYSACFVLPVEDSMEGIFDALKYQALIHKSGGGTGFAFSRLRQAGAMVKTSGGVASGPVSFMRIFDAATNEVKQGGKRRGANMGILRVDHPDILDFIHCKEEGGITNFNISVAITDRFMKAYNEDGDYELVDPKKGEVVGTLSAKRVFDEIAEGAWRTGDPGVIFIDRINKGRANPIPSMGPIESTNPCVTGETLVYTNQGLISVRDLQRNQEEVKILVDKRLDKSRFYRPLRVLKSGVKEVYQLITKEGYELELTKDHRVMTSRGWKEAGQLTEDDEIYISNRKGGFGLDGTLEEGRILGWLVGDGTMKTSAAVLSFFGDEKQELAPYFAQSVSRLVDGMQTLNRSYSVGIRNIKDRDEARVVSQRLWRYAVANNIYPGDKLKIPERVYRGSQDMQVGFLQALFTADGHVSGRIEKEISARLTSISLDLLKGVQRILLNFGIASKIYTELRSEQVRSIPDGKGGIRPYHYRAYHDLVVSKGNLWKFAKEIGFLSEAKNRKLVSLLRDFRRGPYKEKFTARFSKLVRKGIEEVYDLIEPATHSFVANGIVVHNCGEQPLYPFDACNLGSIFLNQFVKKEDGRAEVDWQKLQRVTKEAVRFLDNVIEVNPYPLWQIQKTVFAARRIGLGVGGWADMLIDLAIPYDSEVALDLGEKIMKAIQETAVEASRELAQKRGPFPLFGESIYKNEKPRRNSTVTTIAPTGTIAIIADASSGIEPVFALAFQHIVKDKHINRTLNFINPRFEQVARDRGVWSSELEKYLLEHGTVRDFSEVPEDLRSIFGTSHEIHHDWHIRMQATFQKYTENAVSKTINMVNAVTPDEIKKSYLLAWDAKCNGVTVFRDGCKDAQVLNVGLKNGKPVKKEENHVWERPMIVPGSTYKIKTPVGTAFITVNHDDSGSPIEVFINIGRAGSDVQALAEALGRLISKSLNFGSQLTARERALTIIDQLKGIGGRRSVGFGSNKILSLPDAVAVALANHLGISINGNGVYEESLIEANGTTKPEPKYLSLESAPSESVGDICPSCGVGSLVYEEGCVKCHSCGYSEC